MRRIHIEVVGRVQGVGFRWFVRERASAHGVSGWVRNRADGCVELAAEGDEHSITALLDDVRRGPPGARVISLNPIDPMTGEPLPRPFSIHR